MKTNSIRLRLLLVAMSTILVVLVATAGVLSVIFQRHMEVRVEQELEKHFVQLVAALEFTPSGELVLTQQLADPRFLLPLSGLYWQVDDGGRAVARSRSLWDERLAVPTPPTDASEAHIHELPGPDGQRLFSLEKAVFLPSQGKDKLLVVTVGLESGEINDNVVSFVRDIAPALLAIGLVLLLATWVQLSMGLKPLAVIESAVHEIRSGKRLRMAETVAAEVKPLVAELNELLAANEQRNREARQRAGDLAHGLRTPLTVLGSVSRNLKKQGLKAEGEKIRVQTEHMRELVEWELAMALSSAEDAASWLDLAAHVRQLIRVVSMSEGGIRHLWANDIPAGTQCLVSRNDLNEILGNILENALKWAANRVVVRLEGQSLIVEDDGPGIGDGDYARLAERGYRGESQRPGNGLGLAIAKQLVDKNGMSLHFSRSPLGGLSVGIVVPSEKLREAPAAEE